MKTSLILKILFHFKTTLVSIRMLRFPGHALVAICIHHQIILAMKGVQLMRILLRRLELSQRKRIVLAVREVVRCSSFVCIISSSLHLTMLLISCAGKLALKALEILVVLEVGIVHLALSSRHWSSTFLLLVGYTSRSFAEHVSLNLRLCATYLIIPVVLALIHRMKFTEVSD